MTEIEELELKIEKLEQTNKNQALMLSLRNTQVHKMLPKMEEELLANKKLLSEKIKEIEETKKKYNETMNSNKRLKDLNERLKKEAEAAGRDKEMAESKAKEAAEKEIEAIKHHFKQKEDARRLFFAAKRLSYPLLITMCIVSTGLACFIAACYPDKTAFASTLTWLRTMVFWIAEAIKHGDIVNGVGLTFSVTVCLYLVWLVSRIVLLVFEKL